MQIQFNFSRWWLLVGLHWAENRRRYGLALLAMAGLFLFWFLVSISFDTMNPLSLGYQFGTYFIGLFFTGCLYGSQIFSTVSRKREAIQYLMVPASHLEKLLCGLFFGVVLFFIAYTLLFYLVDIPMVHLAESIVRKSPRYQTMFNESVLDDRTGVLNIFNGSKGELPSDAGTFLLLVYLPVQAAFILGSVYFTRYALLKTIIASLLICLLGGLFMSRVIQMNLPAGWQMENLFDWFRPDNKTGSGMAWVRLPSGIKDILYGIIEYSLPFIFWVITYFRLKEKEV